MYLFVTVYSIYWLRRMPLGHPFVFSFQKVAYVIMVGVSWPPQHALDSTSAARQSGSCYVRRVAYADLELFRWMPHGYRSARIRPDARAARHDNNAMVLAHTSRHRHFGLVRIGVLCRRPSDTTKVTIKTQVSLAGPSTYSRETHPTLTPS